MTEKKCPYGKNAMVYSTWCQYCCLHCIKIDTKHKILECDFKEKEEVQENEE